MISLKARTLIVLTGASFVIFILMMFATVSSSTANPGPSQINFTANPYLDMAGGLYGMNLTAYVYDASGNPAVDGTAVDFNIDMINVTINGSIPPNNTDRYLPVRTGNLNGNNSPYASIPTIDGKAVVRYGWFSDNEIPTGYVMITAAINNTSSVRTTLNLVFNGTTQVNVIIIPTIKDMPTPTPFVSVGGIVAIIIGAGLYMIIGRWRQ